MFRLPYLDHPQLLDTCMNSDISGKIGFVSVKKHSRINQYTDLSTGSFARQQRHFARRTNPASVRSAATIRIPEMIRPNSAMATAFSV